MENLTIVTGAIGIASVLSGLLLSQSMHYLNTDMVLLSLSSILFGGFMLTMAMLLFDDTY